MRSPWSHSSSLGILLICATGPLTKAEEERYGLVSGHAYAVLDVREACGKRLLQIKNPWAHKRWKGPFCPQDKVNWTPALRRALQYDQAAAMQFDNGIFWMDYDSLRKH